MSIVPLIAFILGMLIALAVLNFSLNSHEEMTAEPEQTLEERCAEPSGQ